MANLSNINNRLIVTDGGNLLVNKTAANNAAVGVQLMSTGDVNGTVSGDTVARFNRLSDDGEIIRFQQDTSTDGAINSLSGRIAIGSGTTGIFFDSIRDVLTPHNMTTNAYSTNISLGRDLIRFKDLYLSGIANIAGSVTTPQINLNSAGGGIIDNQTANIFIQTPAGGGWFFRNGAPGYAEKMRIDSSGTIISSKDAAGLQTNLLLSNLNDTDGDTAGIGFSMLNSGTYIKSGIYFERTTTQGRGDLIFATNNTVDGQNVALADEAMRIRPNKVVEIGANSAQSIARLNTRVNGSAIEFGHTNNGDWYFGTVGSYGSAGNPFISFACWNEQSANTWTTKGVPANIIRQDSGGSLQFMKIAATNSTGQSPTLAMELYDGGRLHPVGGIFLGSSNNSNLLDDYEEGTWTPNVTSTSVSSYTAPANGSAQYTKIGEQVRVSFHIEGITANAGVQYFVINGLPFTQRTAGHDEQGFCDNYPVGNRRSGIIINNTGSNVTTWYVAWYNNTSQTNSQVRGTIIYTTTQ